MLNPQKEEGVELIKDKQIIIKFRFHDKTNRLL